MAQKKVSVGVEITGTSKSLQKAADDAARAANKLNREIQAHSKQMKKALGDTSGVVGELGGAIGGVTGDITNMIAGIVATSGPLAILTTAITGVALAWGRSRENMELYLKSADKVQFGFAGYAKDAKEARVDTRRRAEGETATGVRNLRIANFRYTKATTDEERAQLKVQMDQASAMITHGNAILEQVKGVKSRIAWELQYNKLLQEQEIHSDKLKGLSEKRWEAMEAELNRQRLITKETKIPAEAEKARIKALEIAGVLLKEKNESLDEELRIGNALAKMTVTEEVAEDHLRELEKQKETNIKEYTQDLLKVNRFFKEANALSKEGLQIQKEYNTHTSEGFKIEPLKASTKGLKETKFGEISSRGGLGIQPFGGLNQDEIDSMLKENEFLTSLEGVQNVVGDLQNAFANMFTSISSGSNTAFEDMSKAFARSLEQMAAQMASKAVVFGILTLLSGGTGAVAGFAQEILGGRNLKKFMGFANGTDNAPGGLAWVGERGPELVNLPQGSKVTPNNKLGQGGQTIKLQLTGRFDGKDIYFATQNYTTLLDQNT